MNKLTGVLIFAVGATTGFGAAWRYAKVKYERIAEAEISSVKETFRKKEQSRSEEIAALKRQSEIICDEGYTDGVRALSRQRNTEESGPTKGISHEDGPYIISPDDFDENNIYEKISLTYYSDGVLVDEDDDPVSNQEETVGFEFVNYFGAFEKDCVYVRNDALECDYEILRDERNYSEVKR